MTLDAKRLLELEIPTRQVTYADRDVMLYALSVGAGATGPGDDLHLVYEDRLTAIPSFAQVLAFSDSWLEDGGVDLRHVVHGALDLTFHRPVAPGGSAEIASRIAGLDDKGEGKGGLILQETIVSQGGKAICTSLSTLFVRGGGGFGGSVGISAPKVPSPVGEPEKVVDISTSPNQALLFRLLGDRNPLHADPAVAQASGYPAPILHGACSFGIACQTILRNFCDLRPDRLERLAARFAGPLIPGETVTMSFWRDGASVLFRAVAKERGKPVLENGLAVIRD